MQRKADRSMRRRLLFVAAVFGVLCFCVLAGRIFYLQVAKFEEYQQTWFLSQKEADTALLRWHEGQA